MIRIDDTGALVLVVSSKEVVVLVMKALDELGLVTTLGTTDLGDSIDGRPARIELNVLNTKGRSVTLVVTNDKSLQTEQTILKLVTNDTIAAIVAKLQNCLSIRVNDGVDGVLIRPMNDSFLGLIAVTVM